MSENPAQVLEAPATEVDVNAAGANAPGSWESIPLMERPSEIPEKFYKDGHVNVKALAESYGELERSRSTQAQQPVNQQPVNQPPVNQAPVNQAPVQVVIPGVEQAQIANYTQEIATTGTLSPQSYSDLAAKGYSKNVVDSYIKGLVADQMAASAVSEARVADQHIQSIISDVGGNDNLTSMLAWAVGNVEANELTAYNAAVSSNDPNTVRLAVQGMFARYSRSQEPQFITGRNGSLDGVQPFRSNEEVVRAMEDPRYDRDQAYRDEVAARISVSNVFGQSREYKTKESYQQ